VLSWSIAYQVGQLRVGLVNLHANYAKRAKQSLLESHPANIFPMWSTAFLLTLLYLERLRTLYSFLANR
jgi:hypothetical protein